MEIINDFFNTFFLYIKELWLVLAIGFLLSGIFYKFTPTGLVEKYLGRKGFLPIFFASFVGIILPVCCIGSLPIAVTLKNKGASLGAVLAFLIATPATSISALVVSWQLLGMSFTLWIFVSVMVMGIVAGLIVTLFPFSTEGKGPSQGHCCHEETLEQTKDQIHLTKLKEALKYAFIHLPKDMGKEILIGVAVASFITVYDPIQEVIRQYVLGAVGYAFVLGVGLFTYVCSTASVPLADALMKSGLSSGQGLIYLMVGPITSYGTLLVVNKNFGKNMLIVYLAIICIFSIFCGIIFDTFGT